MADAIAAVPKKKGGKPMLFSLCEWGWVRVGDISYIGSLIDEYFTEPSLALGKDHGSKLEGRFQICTSCTPFIQLTNTKCLDYR